MWSEFLHHISIHFPIVSVMGLGAIGLFALKNETPELQKVLRWGGWAAFVATTVALVSGIVSAPGMFGGGGSPELTHHRDLGITLWIVVGLAVWSYDYGYRHNVRDLRSFGVMMWCVAVFAVVGTGHFGGSELHPSALPWVGGGPKTTISLPDV